MERVAGRPSLQQSAKREESKESILVPEHQESRITETQASTLGLEATHPET